MVQRAKNYWTLSCVAVAMVAAAGSAQAGGGYSTRADRADVPAMQIEGAALPPAGFLALCARSPQDCIEDVDRMPDLAALEAAANRNFWSDVFQPRSAPAALPRPDLFDWTTVFARSAVDRVAKTPAAKTLVSLADNPIATSDAGSVAAASATSQAAEPGQPALEASAAVEPSVVALGAVAAPDGLAVRDKADAFPFDVYAPLEAGAYGVAGKEAGAVSAADMGTPAVELAAQGASGLAASAADVPVQGDSHIRVGVDTIAGAPVLADRADHRTLQAAAVFTLDRAGWRLVNGVNRRLNREIRQVSDSRLYGIEDFWNRPEGNRPQGDCEDYVLAKRAALIAEGVPAAVLSIAIVETSWGESHAVLLLASDRGEFILDSLSPWVLRWDRVNYTWRERQMPGRPFDWVRVAV